MAARIFTWLDNSISSEIKKTDIIDLPSIYGFAEGKKGNKNLSVGVTFDDSIQNLSMGEATSLPLACGVKMFLDGVISQRGIHAPESGIIDPKIFLDYFAKEIGDGVELSPLITIKVSQLDKNVLPLMWSDIFSAIIIVGAFVFPAIKLGIKEASTTLKESTP